MVDTWHKHSKLRTYSKGDYIFHQGDADPGMYVVDKGLVAILKETEGDPPVTLGYRNRGEVFGEVSLLADTVRTASVVALEPTTVHYISKDVFWSRIHDDEEFRSGIIKTLINVLLNADHSRVKSATTERKMSENIQELSNENDRLSEIMTLRHETIHFIVHDLRNPLNLTMLALSMMGDDVSTENEMFLGMAQDGVQRMLRLVDTMLDVERLEDDGLVLDYELFDLAEMVAEAVERFQALAERKEVVLLLNRPDGMAQYITADKERIDRVITNLLDNALKYTPMNGTVTVNVEYTDEEAIVNINDTGPGMTDEQRAHVFERFAQNNDEDRRRGFGLGLAFCRSAVLAHDGLIWAEAGDNRQGSKFGFSLPLKTPH